MAVDYQQHNLEYIITFYIDIYTPLLHSTYVHLCLFVCLFVSVEPLLLAAGADGQLLLGAGQGPNRFHRRQRFLLVDRLDLHQTAQSSGLRPPMNDTLSLFFFLFLPFSRFFNQEITVYSIVKINRNKFLEARVPC